MRRTRRTRRRTRKVGAFARTRGLGERSAEGLNSGEFSYGWCEEDEEESRRARTRGWGERSAGGLNSGEFSYGWCEEEGRGK
jgi:hypothetical protein